MRKQALSRRVVRHQNTYTEFKGTTISNKLSSAPCSLGPVSAGTLSGLLTAAICGAVSAAISAAISASAVAGQKTQRSLNNMR